MSTKCFGQCHYAFLGVKKVFEWGGVAVLRLPSLKTSMSSQACVYCIFKVQWELCSAKCLSGIPPHAVCSKFQMAKLFTKVCLLLIEDYGILDVYVSWMVSGNIQRSLGRLFICHIKLLKLVCGDKDLYICHTAMSALYTM